MTEMSISILIVDDEDIMRTVLTRLLSQHGYRVTSVRNGLEAWTILEKFNFDLVICDWNMPHMTGQELLEKIRSSERTREIPFFMLTGDATPGNVARAVCLGINDFIVKPFSAKTIMEKINRIYPLNK